SPRARAPVTSPFPCTALCRSLAVGHHSHAFLAVLGLSDDFEIGMGVEQGGEAGPDHGLVIGDDDANHARSCLSPVRGFVRLSGSTASTSNPPAAVRRLRISPPSDPAR